MNNDNLPVISELVKLPTGKVNISFSELKTWCECSWRHKLQHVDKIDLSKPGIPLDFGKAVHSAHEHFIMTGEIDAEIATKAICKAWEEHKYKEPVEVACKEAVDILADVPAFYASKFEGWKPVAAELMLYERIAEKPHVFKGFIDAIITTPNRKKLKHWILDAKTTGWGWNREKKSDELIQMQLVLYKRFWSLKSNTPLRDIQCGFVLLKRAAKQGAHCELVKVSAGDVTIERSLKRVNNMLKCVNKGVAIKNRDNCTWCDYKDTEWCK